MSIHGNTCPHCYSGRLLNPPFGEYLKLAVQSVKNIPREIYGMGEGIYNALSGIPQVQVLKCTSCGGYVAECPKCTSEVKFHHVPFDNESFTCPTCDKKFSIKR